MPQLLESFRTGGLFVDQLPEEQGGVEACPAGTRKNKKNGHG
jgi:hypothetical protein